MSKKITNNYIIIVKIILSFLTLVVGALVYILLRPSDDIYFVSFLNLDYLNLNIQYRPDWLYNISVGLHTYGMSLLSSIFVASTKRNYLLIVFSWIFINVIFELIQKPYIHDIIYNIFDSKTLGNMLYSLSAGTYDVNDIIFTIYGGFLAYITLILLKRES